MNFMKRAGFVLTCATMLANLCAAQNTERTPQGMKCTTQGMDIRVEFYSPSIVRVYKTPEGKPYNKESLVVVKSPETVKVDFSEEAGQTVLKSSILKVLVNPATGGISFHTIAGNELLKDKDYGTSFADKNDAGTPSYQVRGSFLLDKDEPIYGVGQVMDGKFNRRNSMHHMQINPENQTCRLTKTMRFKKYKNDAYKKKGERGPIQHDQSPPFFFHLNPL